jgi:hypothetical protein
MTICDENTYKVNCGGGGNFWLEGCDPAVLRKSAEAKEWNGFVLRSWFQERKEEQETGRIPEWELLVYTPAVFVRGANEGVTGYGTWKRVRKMGGRVECSVRWKILSRLAPPPWFL